MRVSLIKTKSGDSVPLMPFTILVGPNNVGKSQTLRDIHRKMSSGIASTTTLLESIQLPRPTLFEDLFTGLEIHPHPTSMGMENIRALGADLRHSEELNYNRESMRNEWTQSQNNGNFSCGNIAKFRVALLDASSRLSVANSAESCDAHVAMPANLLQALYAAESSVAADLNAAFEFIFGMRVKLDYSGLRRLRLRVSKNFENIPEDPRKALPILSKYTSLDDQGDGFRSCLGVVLSVLLCRGRLILLDEPEAFLHPAQAKRFGLWIGRHFQEEQNQLVIATHNSSFLSGILNSGADAHIYRLNRTDATTRFHQLSAEIIQNLIKSPLLSSQRVLDAIFHRGVIVCEADADRAIYQTVADTKLNNQEAMFLHSHNKQSIHTVINLLKAASIPAAAVVDFDILNDAGDLTTLASSLSAQHPTVTQLESRDKLDLAIGARPSVEVLAELLQSVTELRDQLNANEHTLSGAKGALNRIRKEATEWSAVKRRGLIAVPQNIRQEIADLLEELKAIGLFVVPVGELEAWINVGATRKNAWIPKALSYLHGNDAPATLREFVREMLRGIGVEPALAVLPSDLISAAPAQAVASAM